jgi:hypothetical protein
VPEAHTLTVHVRMATPERERRSVESVRRVLAYLVSERQELRAHGASNAELEANRKAIVAMQWHLNRALGSRQLDP